MASSTNGAGPQRHGSLIAAPHVAFTELSAQLAELGWSLASSSAAPILPGEPEAAVFVHREDGTQAYYTFNPVVKLRVLQFRGDNRESRRLQAGGPIPVLGLKELRALLDSADIRQILLGLLASDELREVAVTTRVAALCIHPDAKVARTAVRVRDSLLPVTIGQVARQLAAEQARHPERSPWFSNLPHPELRKQTLRWLIHDFEASNPGIDQVLRSALNDPDPEVRITAILAAAKWRTANLLPLLRDADIPTSTSEGAYERDRFLFERLRQTTVGYIGMANPAASEQAREFQHAVSGTLQVRDHATLLFYSLTTPVQLGEKPPRLPEAIEEREGAYSLPRAGLALRWIAPVPHWLGDDPSRLPLPPNPIRQVTPAAGFFIAETPVVSELCSYEEATRLCEHLGGMDGVELQLPTADQWEMAARGPDGRRYPWGNCLRGDGPHQPSPWLVKNLGSVNEWTRDRDAEGAHIVCGGKAPACARRDSVSGDVRCSVRPVLTLDIIR